MVNPQKGPSSPYSAPSSKTPSWLITRKTPPPFPTLTQNFPKGVFNGVSFWGFNLPLGLFCIIKLIVKTFNPRKIPPPKIYFWKSTPTRLFGPLPAPQPPAVSAETRGRPRQPGGRCAPPPSPRPVAGRVAHSLARAAPPGDTPPSSPEGPGPPKSSARGPEGAGGYCFII